MAALSPLHYQLSIITIPKLKALMTPRLTFQSLDHSRKFSARKSLKATFERSLCVLRGLHRVTGPPVPTQRKQCQSFFTVPFSTHRDNRKNATKTLSGARLKFFILTYSAPGSNTLEQPGRGELTALPQL